MPVSLFGGWSSKKFIRSSFVEHQRWLGDFSPMPAIKMMSFDDVWWDYIWVGNCSRLDQLPWPIGRDGSACESRFGASSDDFSLYLPGFRGLSHLELLCHEQPPATWHFEWHREVVLVCFIFPFHKSKKPFCIKFCSKDVISDSTAQETYTIWMLSMHHQFEY